MSIQLPKQGFLHWPVGNGDSTSIVVDPTMWIQVDLNHMEKASEQGDPHTPVVDRLVEILPKVNGRPYLAVFVLSHPDQDHCRGFAELRRRVTIGELWFSPRVFAEFKKDLCDDAKTFREEAYRRVRKTIDNRGVVGSGDRVRVIGYDDLLKEKEFVGFPTGQLSVPGTAVTRLDGQDLAGKFRAFIHAPFKDDADGERNETSIGMQIMLRNATAQAFALLFGDLNYPVLKRIFEVSEEEDLVWNILLGPHHCSKSVMYWREEGQTEETLRQDILDAFEKHELSPGYIVSSSEPIPARNESGDNPPHAKAKQRYLEIVHNAFLCTQEHPNIRTPLPIVFGLDANGLTYLAPASTAARPAPASLGAAVAAARGSKDTPRDTVGFG